MAPRNPALGLGLVAFGALLFVQNAGVSRVALRAGVDPTALTTTRAIPRGWFPRCTGQP